jgi:hypothetical protein
MEAFTKRTGVNSCALEGMRARGEEDKKERCKRAILLIMSCAETAARQEDAQKGEHKRDAS